MRKITETEINKIAYYIAINNQEVVNCEYLAREAVFQTRDWYERTNKPKPYSDPSMKEVLEGCDRINQIYACIDYWNWRKEGFWESDLLDRIHFKYATQVPEVVAILASKGYYPDSMFDDNGNFKHE